MLSVEGLGTEFIQSLLIFQRVKVTFVTKGGLFTWEIRRTKFNSCGKRMDVFFLLRALSSEIRFYCFCFAKIVLLVELFGEFLGISV